MSIRPRSWLIASSKWGSENVSWIGLLSNRKKPFSDKQFFPFFRTKCRWMTLLFERIITIESRNKIVCMEGERKQVKKKAHKIEGFSASLTLLFTFLFNYVEQHLGNCQTKGREEGKKAFQLITTKLSTRDRLRLFKALFPSWVRRLLKWKKIDDGKQWRRPTTWQFHDMTYIVFVVQSKTLVRSELKELKIIDLLQCGGGEENFLCITRYHARNQSLGKI